MSRPPLRLAYSHSASLGRRPPTQRQKASPCAQPTQLLGWFSRSGCPWLHSLPGPGAVQGPCCRQKRYWATVTSLRRILKAGMVTR